MKVHYVLLVAIFIFFSKLVVGCNSLLLMPAAVSLDFLLYGWHQQKQVEIAHDSIRTPSFWTM